MSVTPYPIRFVIEAHFTSNTESGLLIRSTKNTFSITYFPLITYEKLVEREMLFRKSFSLWLKCNLRCNRFQI